MERIGEERVVHRVLVGKPEVKRPMGRPRRRLEDNIKMDLQEVGGGCGDWMELAQDRDRWRALVGGCLKTPTKQPSPYSQFSLKLCTYKPPGTLIESDSNIFYMCTTVSS